MIRLIDVIRCDPFYAVERFVGEQIGYYHILAIDYVKKDILFNYGLSYNDFIGFEKQTLKGKAKHLKRWLKFV